MMAPQTVYSWVEGLRDTKTSEPFVDQDDDVSPVSEDEAVERDWETAKARAILEGKYLDFEEESTLDSTFWRSISPDPDTPTEAARISRLPAARYEPNLTPERLRPTRRNVSRLGRELREVTTAPQQPERSETMKLRPLHTSDDNLDTISLASSPRKRTFLSASEPHLTRAAPEPGTPSRTWKSSSRGVSLQPSDVPYRISWLWPSHFGRREERSEMASAPAISRLFNGPHDDSVDHLAGIKVDFIREEKLPIIQESTDAHQPLHQRNETLTPDDSISSFEGNEYMELPICIPPDIYNHPQYRRQTLVPEDSISYCPSQSTLHYLYEMPAEVVTLKRIFIPPPVVPPKSERRLRKRSMADPMSPSSGDTAIPTFKSPPPSYDLESAPMRAVSMNRLPQGYKPEPLNGTVAWLHAIAGFLVVFNCWGINNSFGLFQTYFESIYFQGTNPSSIAWIGSTQICLCFALGVPVGRLIDKGHFQLVFSSGAIIMICGLFATAWCTQLWNIWICQGLITGAGMGMTFCSGIVALMTWFDERHVSIAMAIGAAGSCVGGIVYVVVARHFLATLGFATTMRILGGIAAATMLPPMIIFRVRGQRHRDTKKGHRRTGFLQEASTTTTFRSFFEASYLLAAIGMFFAFLGVYFGFVYMISYGSVVLHLLNTQSTNLLIFMLAANLPGRFLPALISDKCIGPLNTLVPACILSSAILVLWIAGTQTYASLIVITCFYGFVSAGVQVLYAPTVYSFCMEHAGDNRPSTPNSMDNAATSKPRLATDKIGVKAGCIFTAIGLACLVGTPIGGALISYRTDRDMGQPFLYAQIFAACSLFLGGVLLLASRVVKTGGWRAVRA